MDGPPLTFTPVVITKDQQLQWLRAEITYLEDILSRHGNRQVRDLSSFIPLPPPPPLMIKYLILIFCSQSCCLLSLFCLGISIFFLFSFWGDVTMILPKYEKNLNRSESDTFTIDLALQKTAKWELPDIQHKPHLKNLLVSFLLSQIDEKLIAVSINHSPSYLAQW